VGVVEREAAGRLGEPVEVGHEERVDVEHRRPRL
jgi:hypothetical protein